jgi:hypothetical protein
MFLDIIYVIYLIFSVILIRISYYVILEYYYN